METHPDSAQAATVDQLLAHTQWLNSLARSLVRDEAAAEDLVQETWLTAIRRRPAARDSVKPWLATVLRNAWRKRHRAEVRRQAREEAVEIDGCRVPDPARWAEKLEVERILTDAVSALGEPQRSTLLLHFYEGLSAAEIARRLSLPASTVRSRIRTGLDLLRADLDRRHGARWQRAVMPLASGPTLAAPGSTTAGAAANAKGVIPMIGKKIWLSLFALAATATLVIPLALSQRSRGEESAPASSTGGGDEAISASRPASADPAQDNMSALSAPAPDNESTKASAPRNSPGDGESANDRNVEPDGTMIVIGSKEKDGARGFLGARGSRQTLAVRLHSIERTEECAEILAGHAYEIDYSWDQHETIARRAGATTAPNEELKCMSEYLARVAVEPLRDKLEQLLSDDVTFFLARPSPGPSVGIDGRPYQPHPKEEELAVSPGGPSVGPEDAPVVITLFSDFQCPFCARVVAALDETRDRYPDSVKLVYKHAPLPSHEHARLAAEASIAADAQGKFWEMHDLLYAHQDALDKASLISYAEALELDIARFTEELNSRTYRDLVQEDIDEAAALGVRGTPATIINGELLMGARPAEKFIEKVEAALADR